MYPVDCIKPNGEWLKIVADILKDFLTPEQITTF